MELPMKSNKHCLRRILSIRYSCPFHIGRVFRHYPKIMQVERIAKFI